MARPRRARKAPRARTPEPRDREATRERFLEAIGRLLGRGEFASLGVNSVAREAGSDKVLLYRYFGGIEGLLDAWGQQAVQRLPPAAVAPGGAARPADRATAMLLAYARGLRERPELLEVMRWELIEDNALTRRLAAIREAAGQADFAALGVPDGRAADQDLPAMAAILGAGLLHLALRAHTAPEWLGVPLRTAEGWQRLERAAARIVHAVLAGETPGASAGP